MASPLRRFLRDYLREHPVGALGVLVLMLSASLAALVEPVVVKRVVDEALPGRNGKLLLALALTAIAIRLGEALLQRLQEHLSSAIAVKVFTDFVVQFYAHVQSLDLAFFADTKMGEFMQRLGQDTYHIYRLAFHGVTALMRDGIVVLVFLAYGFYLSPLLTAVTLATLPLHVWAQRVVGRLTRSASEAMVSEWSRVASFQSEKLGGIRLVKELAAEPALVRRYSSLLAAAGDAFRNLELAGNAGQILSGLAISLAPTLVIAVGGYAYVMERLSLGTVLVFFYFSARLFAPIGSIVTQCIAMQRARVGLERIYEYLDRDCEIKETPAPLELPAGPLAIEFSSVSFAYAEGRPVLDSLTLSVQPGETVGIVGTSGAGKSTLANLLYRFWDVESGSLRIGGIDVRSVGIRALRSRLGIVSQETILFHDSIAENLRLACPDTNEACLKDACRMAGIWEFIAALPEGLDTIVGERGVKLSGGQRQRLSIARAILSDPDLLILDEATSHLDGETESSIQRAFAAVVKDRTTLVIAHRLSTLGICDRIVVLESGRVVEVGSHTELLACNGRYAQLWRLQADALPAQQDRLGATS